MGYGAWPFGSDAAFCSTPWAPANRFWHNAADLSLGAVKRIERTPCAIAFSPGGKRSFPAYENDAGARKRHSNDGAYELFNCAVRHCIRRARGFFPKPPAPRTSFPARCRAFRPRSGAMVERCLQKRWALQ